jgi:hypothetical protein
MYIGDVGEWEREEVDFEPAGTPGGRNYGWHCWEGTVNYTLIHPEIAGDCGDVSLYTRPVHDYKTPPLDCASVIGGYVYRGTQFPLLIGDYLFTDFCTKEFWILYRNDVGAWETSLVGNAPFHASTLGEDADGELYVGDYNPTHDPPSNIYRIVRP